MFEVVVDRSTCWHQLSKEVSSSSIFIGKPSSIGIRDVVLVSGFSLLCWLTPFPVDSFFDLHPIVVVEFLL